jgi:CXXX repeat radical SAM target protein
MEQENKEQSKINELEKKLEELQKEKMDRRQFLAKTVTLAVPTLGVLGLLIQACSPMSGSLGQNTNSVVRNGCEGSCAASCADDCSGACKR